MVKKSSGGSERRENILCTAVELLAEGGYNQLSLRDVGRRVGISHPGVIYHFPSREALLMAVIDRYETEIGLSNEDLLNMPVFDFVRDFHTIISKMQRNRMFVEIECHLLVETTSATHPAHDHSLQRVAAFRSLYCRVFQKFSDLDLLKESIDPVGFALTMLGALHGLRVGSLYKPYTDKIETLLAAAMAPAFRPFTPEIVARLESQNLNVYLDFINYCLDAPALKRFGSCV